MHTPSTHVAWLTQLQSGDEPWAGEDVERALVHDVERHVERIPGTPGKGWIAGVEKSENLCSEQCEPTRDAAKRCVALVDCVIVLLSLNVQSWMLMLGHRMFKPQILMRKEF